LVSLFDKRTAIDLLNSIVVNTHENDFRMVNYFNYKKEGTHQTLHRELPVVWGIKIIIDLIANG